jgi:2-C-methyl-D-erythritol 4-phosphate cytidylyltransferase
LIEESARRGWREQSTLQLAFRAGRPVRVVPGEKQNIKLTTADDWVVAEALAERLR